MVRNDRSNPSPPAGSSSAVTPNRRSRSTASQIRWLVVAQLPSRVGVSGPRPLLHVSQSPDSGLARLLRAGGLEVKVSRPERCRWTLEELSPDIASATDSSSELREA